MSTSAEFQLVIQAQSGDALAYGQLYRRYCPYISKILHDDVRDPEARHDLCQSVFERGWQKIGDLRNPAAFRPWLAQLARRQIIDHHRISCRTVATDFTNPGHLDRASAASTAHDWAEMRELAASMRTSIKRLPARDGAVLQLASSHGFTSHEIADALDIEVTHARVLLHRARRRLSRELDAYSGGRDHRVDRGDRELVALSA